MLSITVGSPVLPFRSNVYLTDVMLGSIGSTNETAAVSLLRRFPFIPETCMDLNETRVSTTVCSLVFTSILLCLKSILIAAVVVIRQSGWLKQALPKKTKRKQIRTLDTGILLRQIYFKHCAKIDSVRRYF